MQLKTRQFFEDIANHPKVFQRIEVAGVERADFDWFDAHGIGVGWDDGGFLFYRSGDEWEIHTLFLPGHAPVVDRAKQAIAFALENGAKRVVTMTPVDLIPAIRLCKKCGFELIETIEGGWPRKAGAVDLMVWEYKDV